ncbi:23S rRNA (cytidine(2498)-2'-O)-methyltransferase RlmM [Maribrevibacterium harenarium]|uniref:Ribosomal RNA large subunit methyltransferase M n=1 Tax=Maribrevibacterium harenarium TaxID=2589817 RepID=A0A501WW67_9GAMM|nr:23S rRNA (cytidine(2498)-2'-O)-methyltransferase RlmM [Maribrevibacterium harenarium]TPE52374.1 23S rRNA (cytidine(2498)-2'-O)-methyltransferase RlmM [Maribrevibacterium harenarium]
MKNLVIYCRPGFEKDALAEAIDKAAEAGISGFGRVQEQAGYVVLETTEADAGERIIASHHFNQWIFARQLIAANDLVSFAQGERVQGLLEAARQLPLAQELWLETADTNDAKALAPLLKKIDKPLRQAWKKSGLLRNKAVGLRHHVFFLNTGQAYLGVSYADCRSEFVQGIRRLKFPQDGPSRSTLKLEEAFLQFTPADLWHGESPEQMRAVDLGAAPGGWTYQFVKRGVYTYAIDNGPMQKQLMKTGLVEHIMADGFKYQPETQVDWLVCDMVERPIKVAELMADWLINGWCSRTIFNLKLPMKKRYAEVTQCLVLIEDRLRQAGLGYQLQVKHLFHDREEVTVFIELMD